MRRQECGGLAEESLVCFEKNRFGSVVFLLGILSEQMKRNGGRCLFFSVLTHFVFVFPSLHAPYSLGLLSVRLWVTTETKSMASRSLEEGMVRDRFFPIRFCWVNVFLSNLC